MFTEKSEQRNVMCMMDKEMRMGMYMCMSMLNCASMYRKLPVTSEDHGRVGAGVTVGMNPFNLSNT